MYISKLVRLPLTASFTLQFYPGLIFTGFACCYKIRRESDWKQETYWLTNAWNKQRP